MVSVTLRLPNVPGLSLDKLSTFRRSVSRVIKAKVFWARINVTPYTLVYFLLAFLTCIVMVALQLVLFADNTVAVNKLSGIIASTNVSQGLAINANGVLQYCNRISGMNAAQCVPITSPVVSNGTVGFVLTWRRDLQLSAAEGVGLNCSRSLFWLEGMLNDAKREDIVTLAFQFWLFTLGVAAVLSESLPHLGAAFLGHVLSTGWAGFRIRASYKMMDLYQRAIVSDACEGTNPLGNWWQIKISHTVPVAVVSGIALAFVLFLSYKIYKVYSTQTFSSVGATPTIERILKIVLLYSVTLHLAVFFVVASTAMWINKATNSTISFLSSDKTFLAMGIVTLLLVIPWLLAGWFCIRRECQWRFLSFCIISIVVLSIFTVMFWSGLYRFVFTSWPFFTTITVTAYALVVIAVLLSIWCRFNFGHGFAHFVQVSEVLESMDFPSVYFSNERAAESGIKKTDGRQMSQVLRAAPSPRAPAPPRSAMIMRASVYSNNNVATVKMSSEQPFYSEMQNPSLSPTTSVRSVAQRLRKVFEYRRTREPSSTIIASPLQSQNPNSFQATVPQATSPGEDGDISSNGIIKVDRSKRRSRSVSLSRPPRSRDVTETTAQAGLVLDVPRRAKTGRPLPIRPLPKPPVSAPSAAAPLSRRGGIREPGPNHRLDQVDTRAIDQQW